MKNLVKGLVITAGMLTVGQLQATPIQWTSGSGGNDHYYEFVTTPVDWDAAFAGAQVSTYLGMQGYLATVTSAAENSFIGVTVLSNTNVNVAWIGGSDAAQEGVWRWMDGPEAGQIFYGAGAPAGAFTSWNNGEPNNVLAGEDHLQINWAFVGGWNDHGDPQYPDQVNGYVIEYSAVPEPVSYAMFLLGLLGLGLQRRLTRN